jgi:hypothetical protein
MTARFRLSVKKLEATLTATANWDIGIQLDDFAASCVVKTLAELRGLKGNRRARWTPDTNAVTLTDIVWRC